MTETEDRARLIFLAALERAPGQWPAWLDEACGSDAELRARVNQLLQAHRAMGSIHAGDAEAPQAGADESIREGPGTLIGPYKLLEQIGEGGFGVVFLAEQTQPVRRKLALKILKPGMDTRQVIARFEAERQALAIMDHPNIAKVLDGGATASGRPYFVMELVKGVPITEFCDQNQMTARQRLELFVPVCQAVQHAHQKGIIHRDLKPSNVLVSRHDTTPVVKVIDFGVAKALGQELTDKTLFTGLAQMIGTPLYMSPEQAGMSDLDVDTRSDIYTLGVLLYELLTGTTPFDKERFKKAAYDEIRRIIRDEEPPKPSTRLTESKESLASISAQRQTEPAKLTKLMRGELDWIVMKALEKDRNRRYETANGFAADVQRYLADEPVQACPPTAWYRFGKFARRHKGLLAATGLILLTLVTGMIGTMWALIKVRQGEAQARQSEAEAKAVLEFFEKRVLSAARPKRGGQGVGPAVTIRDAVDLAEPGIAEAFQGQPLVEASIRRALGLTYWYAGDYPLAIGQHLKALALRKAHLPLDHPDTLNSMTNLAQAYQSAGRLTDALELLQETLKLRRARLGPNDPETLWTMNRLGETLQALGCPGEALPLYEEELRIAKTVLGPDHEDTLIYMDKLAAIYQNLGRLAEAVALFEKTLELEKKNLPPDHPDLLATKSNLAWVYSEVGRWDEAEKLGRETLEVKKTVFGFEHPETLISMHNLGTAYRDDGRPAEALPLLEEAVRLQTAKQGRDHYITLIFMGNLATVYRNLDRLAEAKALFNETLRLQKAKVGADHLRRLLVMNEAGDCLLKMKQYDEAESLLRDCLALRVEKDPADWWVSQTRSQLGQVAAGLKRYAEAEALLREAHQELVARRDKIPARYQRCLGEAARALADLYEALGKKDEAAQWRGKI